MEEQKLYEEQNSKEAINKCNKFVCSIASFVFIFLHEKKLKHLRLQTSRIQKYIDR